MLNGTHLTLTKNKIVTQFTVHGSVTRSTSGCPSIDGNARKREAIISGDKVHLEPRVISWVQLKANNKKMEALATFIIYRCIISLPKVAFCV